MQKKLLSLAIASALAIPGAAMADVKSKSGGNIEIYGKIHASYDFVDNDAASPSDDSDDNTGVFRQSRIGFKGAEDLGNGLKGIWQIETFVDTTEDGDNPNTGSLGLRNTFVGLQGDQWGTISFGRIDTPYKTSTDKLDIFADTIADYNNILGSIQGNMLFNSRPGTVAAYATPNFNGFNASIARISYQYDEPDGEEESEAWSAMAMYDQGPFFASVAYELASGEGLMVDSTTTGKEEIDSWKIGLGYTFGNTKAAFIYEDIEHDDNNDDGFSRDAYWAALSHKFGANEVKLAYGKADGSDDNDDDGADNWSIGIDHNFSKRTKVYAIYTDMDNDSAGQYGLFNGQVHGTGGGNTYNAPAPDADMSAFSVGIVHKF